MKTQNPDRPPAAAGLNNFIRVWHLAIIALCLAAWLTGDLADDYKKVEHTGFIIHGGIGMAFAAMVCLYLGHGIAGPQPARFSQWFPFTRARLRQTGSELATLARFQLPQHTRHQGLAGLVQFSGILVFLGLAATGAWLYFFLEPGSKARGVLHTVKEAHEVGEVLIPLFLGVHVGAVIVHTLTGDQVWRDIFFAKKPSR